MSASPAEPLIIRPAAAGDAGEHLGWTTDGSTKQERFGARVTEVRYVLAIRSPA